MSDPGPCASACSGTSELMGDDNVEPCDSEVESDTCSGISTIAINLCDETSTSTIMSPPSEPVSLLSGLESPSPSGLCRKEDSD